MRQIGTLDHEDEARRFAAFLVTSGIAAQPEPDGQCWAIWVREENQLEHARLALAEFRRDPADPRYRDVESEAQQILREEAKRREQARKNVIEMRGRWGHVAGGRRPLVLTLVVLSIGVGLASNMGREKLGATVRALAFADPIHLRDPQWNPTVVNDRLIDVRQGQLWRVITPIFVHWGAMHLAFNMIMFYQLGSMVEVRRGTWRLGLMILAIAALSNLGQALLPGESGTPFFAGMSGVVYGLFGYIWMKSVFAPEMGLALHRTTVIILMAWLFLGFAGVLNRGDVRIANWTHGIGFLAGLAIGYIPELIRQR